MFSLFFLLYINILQELLHTFVLQMKIHKEILLVEGNEVVGLGLLLVLSWKIPYIDNWLEIYEILLLVNQYFEKKFPFCFINMPDFRLYQPFFKICSLEEIADVLHAFFINFS